MLERPHFYNGLIGKCDDEADYKLYHFDGYSFDARRKVLYFGGANIHLGSRASHLLLFLLKRGGRVQLKKDLINAVWGATVVEECNLRAQIYQIRRALSKVEGLNNLLTVPGVGYVFVGNVYVGGDSP